MALSENQFPSSFVPQEEKKGKKYLTQYAKDLWNEAKNQSTTFSFNTRKEKFIQNRKYSAGLNSIEKFKQQFSIDGDNTYLNFDWAVSTPLPKMVEVMRGQMINQPFKIDFKAVDSTSITQFDREKKLLKAEMVLKEQLAPLEQQGVVKSKDNIPEDDDELQIYMESNFKLAQSIAMESITQAILEDNDIDYINERISKDLIDIKIAGARVSLDENKNIQVSYIDPVDLVTSYTKRPDFRDIKHAGVLIDTTIEDLRVMAQGELTETDLFEIAKSVAGKYGNSNYNGLNRKYYDTNFDWEKVDKFKVTVLDFEMFSTDVLSLTKVQAKNGGYKMLINEEPKNSKAEKAKKEVKIKNVYIGKYIVDTDYIFDFGLKEHILRERLNGKYSTNTSLGFILYAPDIYDMENKSKVEEMIPFADELIRIQLKMQQIISKAAPSGYAINVDAVIAGLQGMGLSGMTPLDARSMRDQIGDIYYKSIREDGTSLTGGQPAVTSLPNGLDNSIMLLAQAYIATVERMKEAIAMNDAVDASQADKRAAVGVQKLSSAGHKNALRTLNNAYLRINEEIARQVSMLAQQLIRKGINLSTFENMVGEEAVKQIGLSDLSTSDFAISIKMLPEEEEKAFLENKIELSLQNQVINLEDVFAIRRAMQEDVDKAEQLLSVREKRRRKENEKRQALMQEQNAQMQIQVAQAAEQAKLQTVQTEAQLEAQNMQMKYDLELRNQTQLEDEKRKTMALEIDGKKELLEKAAELENQKLEKEKSGETAYDKINLPKESGSRMPSVTPTTT